jgi:ribonuclease P protein component
LPDNEFHYAVLVSKRLGSAPERNRIKRKFREAIRLGGRQAIGTGKILILPRNESKAIGFEPIKESLIRALERISKPRGGQSGRQTNPPTD